MFTGIVTDIGEVVAVEPRAQGLARLKIACGYDPDTIAIGASIACSGVCLTVVERGREGNRGWFAVDAAAETLRVTTVGDWRQRQPHQSRARAQDRRRARRAHRRRPCRRPCRADRARGFDRHGAAHVPRAPPSSPASSRRRARSPLDGVSLTVNEVAGDTFSVLIIPHTLQVTTLGTYAIGDAVNLEVDLMARYAARLMERRR